MKIRIGFVSNSSSSSFILDKRYITPEDILKIKNYCDYKCIDSWELREDNDFLKGFTVMDNGDLFEWIRTNLDIHYKAIVQYDKD